MEKLSNTGRIFYGIAMAVLGFQTIYYRDFPYMMIPPHSGTKVLVIIAYLSGILLIAVFGNQQCTVFGSKNAQLLHKDNLILL